MLPEALDSTLRDAVPVTRSTRDRPGEARLRCPTCGRDLPASYVVCPRDATPLGVSSDARDPLIGAVLAGTYRLTRVLGRGGMGRLYEAEHARLGRRFAVKVLHEAHADRMDAAARFEREAQALARIQSDFVLDVVDVLRAPDGRAAIITDLLEGEDLQRRLDRAGRLPAGEAVAIAREVCRGLAAAHAVGVVHRDLKPSNVFLSASPDGRMSVKILDFGVAKITDQREVTKSGVVLGTPAYMAPEQARGSARADALSDVYAVGALLYRMLTGRPPYEGGEAAIVLTELLAGPPPRPRALAADLPEALELVIQRAMSREPSSRPASALDLEAELASFGGDDISRSTSAMSVGPGRETSDTTVVLPRGSVERAEELARSARRARPSVVAQSALATLGSGAAAATAITALGALGLESALVHALAIVGSFAAALAVAGVSARSASARWSSAAECEQLAARLARANTRALALTGAVFLGALAWAALGGAMALAPLTALIALSIPALALRAINAA